MSSVSQMDRHEREVMWHEDIAEPSEQPQPLSIEWRVLENSRPVRCSPGPYLELFARRTRPGWHVWGNEVSCDVAL